MGLTKIIHVLKNDNFGDVFDSFKNVDANEVILILPNNSKIARQSQNFVTIKNEADATSKRVSIMTTDPVVIQLAMQSNIEVLQAHEPKRSQTTASRVSVEPVIASEDVELEQEDREAEYEDNLVAKLAVAKVTDQVRTIKDIIGPNKKVEHSIRINEEKTSPFNVEISKNTSEEKTRMGEIEKVWTSKESDRSIKKVKTSKIFRRIPIFFVAGTLVVLLLILYVTLGSAKIIIRPQKQPLNFQIKASASTAITELNLNFNRLPGQRFSYKDQESSTFPVTGQKEVVQKASGKITIYNKSLTPQRLVATTRFESSSGLIFRIPQTIEIPAATGVDANLKEGSLESIIFADKAGGEYNIEPTTFTIPGFKGTPKQDQFYAKSTRSTTGGIIGPSKVVTEEDFIKAQEAVTAKLKEKIIRLLKNEAGELKILDSLKIKMESPVSNAKVGEAAENLQITIAGSASTLAFRDSDIIELIKNYIAQKGDLELLEKNLVINYLNPENSSDGLMMTFDIQVTGQSTNKIDEAKIRKEIAGLKEDEMRTYFTKIKEIESTRIILGPFWVKRIPKDLDKIKLIIEKD
ncbi:MAG: hypothetical protein AAB784_00575 [Patescibacteria group bacterium]